VTDKIRSKTDAEPVADSMQSLFETMTSLLGRLALPPDELKKIVMKAKRKPEDYIKAYNLCDGEHSVRQIVTAIDVSIGTLSPILAGWKDLGIIYEVTKKGGKFYKRLYPLEAPRATDSSKKQGEKPEGFVEEPPQPSTPAKEPDGTL